MKLIKKTGEYSIYERGDSRYAVKNGDKQPVNGEEKVKILLAEGLIKVTEPSAPAEPEPEEASADDGDAQASESGEAESSDGDQ
jgi:hypothetical protein